MFKLGFHVLFMLITINSKRTRYIFIEQAKWIHLHRRTSASAVSMELIWNVSLVFTANIHGAGPPIMQMSL